MEPRQRVLTDPEIALVWQATQGETAGAMERRSKAPIRPGRSRFLLLTAVRRNEAARMVWGRGRFR
jgi:hypothetical protein